VLSLRIFLLQRLSVSLSGAVKKVTTASLDPARRMQVHRGLRITDPAALSAHYVLLQAMVPGENLSSPANSRALAISDSAMLTPGRVPVGYPQRRAQSAETARWGSGDQDWSSVSGTFGSCSGYTAATSTSIL
jgi:hypothetical protein